MLGLRSALKRQVLGRAEAGVLLRNVSYCLRSRGHPRANRPRSGGKGVAFFVNTIEQAKCKINLVLSASRDDLSVSMNR